MKLAFYYHIPIRTFEGHYFLPSYLGVFIDALASEVDTLILVMHESSSVYSGDYRLNSCNIVWINLGPKTPSWHRVLFHNSVLKSKISSMADCDIFLVRSPSPLAVYFSKYFDGRRIVYMIVGDYSESLSNIKIRSPRDFFIKILLSYINNLFEKSIIRSEVLVNSTALYNKYVKLVDNVHQIRTTTLRNDDFFFRDDTCNNVEINLIYSGRIDIQKGLFELIEAFYLLRMKGQNVIMNIVGWDDDKAQRTIQELKALIIKRGIEAYVCFHGKKSVGVQLNEMYRKADIFVLSSYHEGFPRTIWEAMANSLPVIATGVGSIPYFLDNGLNCILIPPKDIHAISDAIEKIIFDKDLRRSIIRRGYAVAQENTLEIQTKKLIKLLQNVEIN